MAGIYIHIPFCKTRCIYCDFYSTTHGELKHRYIQALCRELGLRRGYLKGEPVKTIYFGGGTPSQLDEEDFRQVFDTLAHTYGLQDATEITLEANPDDLTEEYIHMLHTLPFNRISMGIQTFDDATLKLLNRRHNASQAKEAVKRCREAGFQNISIDLIYGLPGETASRWAHDLQEAIALQPAHISAYHLTYEKGTRLHQLLEAHTVREADEDSSLLFFTMLKTQLENAGYVHYEISNFCKPGLHSRHNTSYWQGIPYLGCGPTAHSFDIRTREWNVPSLHRYLEALEAGQRDYEREELDTLTRYNEYVMTSLRTMWGLSLDEVETQFGQQLHNYCQDMAAPYLKSGMMQLTGQRLCLTPKGIFVSDGIISDLFAIQE